MSNIIVPNKELLVGQFARTEELNERIYSRNVPDTHLENWFTPQSFSTRFVKMPTIPPSSRNGEAATAAAAAPQPELIHFATSSTPQNFEIKNPPYNTERTFAAVTRTAPFRGFSSNVDIESSLHNQFYALQNSDQAVYIPSSTSDLYNVTAVGRYEEQTHPGLFTKYNIDTTAVASNRPNIQNIGNDRWFNHTRTQLRNI